jgi:hypothetical protein
VVATERVVTVNVACSLPAGTVTETGTVAAPGLELDIVTTVPDGPACPFKLTVAVTTVAEPPTTVVGDSVTDRAQAGRSVWLHVFAVAPTVAVRVIAVLESTPSVATVKLAMVAPASTVTDAGNVMLALFELRDTTVPPVGAGAFMVTVPVG